MCYQEPAWLQIIVDYTKLEDMTEEKDETEVTIYTESLLLLKNSFPLIIAFLLQYSLTVASVFSVGRLGSVQLAAISLSSMTANVTGYAIIQGILTSLDTLCPQSFGKGDFNAVGIHLWKCNYFLLILFVPIAFVWILLSEHILYFFIPDLELVSYASTYLCTISLGLPGFILFENGKHFLQAQGIFHASTYVLLFCAPFNAFLNYFLVWHTPLNFLGAPISIVITNYLMCLLLYLYIFFVDGFQCWPCQPLYHSVFFINWKKMVKLSIPGVLMVESEWLAFEIITFQASKFGTNVLAAQSIINTTCVLLYQIPFAISIAASTKVAWYIGATARILAESDELISDELSISSSKLENSLNLSETTPIAENISETSPLIREQSKSSSNCGDQFSHKTISSLINIDTCSVTTSTNYAITASNAAVLTSLSIGCINAVTLYNFRHWFASLFSNDLEVIALASKILIIVAFYQINDFLSCSTGGILRGQGRQKIGGYINLFSYYVLALPAAGFFAFYLKLELVGLWLGMIIALFIGSSLQWYFVASTNWELVIRECLNDGIPEEFEVVSVRRPSFV